MKEICKVNKYFLSNQVVYPKTYSNNGYLDTREVHLS